jgi:fatty-acyl-CoA synthase
MAGFTFTPLTPSAYLDRAAWVFRDRTAVVDGERSFTYAEFADRAHRLAGALLGLGVPPGGRVAALCVNSHIMLELHNGVPLAGAVLVPLNIRLSRRSGRRGHRRRGGGRGQARHRRRRAG